MRINHDIRQHEATAITERPTENPAQHSARAGFVWLVFLQHSDARLNKCLFRPIAREFHARRLPFLAAASRIHDIQIGSGRLALCSFVTLSTPLEIAK